MPFSLHFTNVKENKAGEIKCQYLKHKHENIMERYIHKEFAIIL